MWQLEVENQVSSIKHKWPWWKNLTQDTRYWAPVCLSWIDKHLDTIWRSPAVIRWMAKLFDVKEVSSLLCEHPLFKICLLQLPLIWISDSCQTPLIPNEWQTTLKFCVTCKQWQLFGRSQAPDRLIPHEPTSSLRSLERGRVHFIGIINVKCSKREKDTKV